VKYHSSYCSQKCQITDYRITEAIYRCFLFAYKLENLRTVLVWVMYIERTIWNSWSRNLRGRWGGFYVLVS